MIRLLTIVVLVLFCKGVCAQKKYPDIKINTDAGHLARLKAINRDIWQPFTEAYARGDADAYMALHMPDVIRADIHEVKGLEGHRTSSKRHFDRNRNNNRRCEIAFTFFERVAGTDMASERGIYRYTAIPASGETQHYYGKFHVIHRLYQGKWRIAVDYDSDEDGRIGKADFEAGVPPDIFEKKAETPVAEAAIRKAITGFSAKVVAGDWAGVANAYTDDAAIFPPNQMVIRGKKDILAFWSKSSKVNYHKIIPVEIMVENGTAYDWGIYEGSSVDKDGKETRWEGKYVIVWKNIADGDWRIYLDSWSRLPENTRAAMKKIIAVDDSLGRTRNHACERVSLSESIRAYIADMEKMDFSTCSADFASGFRQHMDAWSSLLPFTDKYPALRGEMHTLFKQLEEGPEGVMFKTAVGRVWDTRTLIEHAMKNNGL